MKVLDTEIDDNEVWFKVKLDRNTQILAKDLFTYEDIEYFKRAAVEAYIRKLTDKLIEFNS